MPSVSEIDAQIEKLEREREMLIENERSKAYAKAETAVQELNALGFNYVLQEANKPTTTRTRRTGVRESVKKAIAGAPDGIAPAAIAEQLGMTDKAGKQSISNALSALKKTKTVTAQNGLYLIV